MVRTPTSFRFDGRIRNRRKSKAANKAFDRVFRQGKDEYKDDEIIILTG